MSSKIAVEQNLTPVKDYLAEKGYRVQSIGMQEETPEKLRAYDAIVVTGMHINILGIQDTMTDSFVINADGLTPEEIEWELKSNGRMP